MATGTGPDAPWVLRAREHARGVPGLSLLSKLGGFVANPFVGAAIGAAGSIAQTVWSARRADSAHQREVRDLQAAGINPLMTARGSGSEVGQMVSPSEGIGSALGIQRQRAEIELLRAQAHNAEMAGRLSATQANEISTFSPGRGAEVAARTERSAEELRQMREQFPAVLARARAEVGQVKSSARRNDAETMLARANELLTKARTSTESVSARYAEDWLKLYDQMGDAGYPLRLVALALASMFNVRR